MSSNGTITFSSTISIHLCQHEPNSSKTVGLMLPFSKHQQSKSTEAGYHAYRIYDPLNSQMYFLINYGLYIKACCNNLDMYKFVSINVLHIARGPR